MGIASNCVESRRIVSSRFDWTSRRNSHRIVPSIAR
ncbi:hypothetical protein HALLA_14445 [Halostagnicola larsenii XH-48]|uniref:Uncharacterized protein n=1 Tax=Halostagnicola larsenii XH-48 TaxID=797299 RepID=W0JQP2_9EURY|nr:hypothetical protein HALLA_14445 [Halostagnicola larsenii XH-48]